VICLRCDARPRAAGTPFCAECSDDIKHGRPLPAPAPGTVELRYSDPERVVGRIINVGPSVPHKPTGAQAGECGFCRGKRDGRPLCEKCSELLHGFRAYLRSICSTLPPLTRNGPGSP
jgi:hypothetical protein